MSDNSTLPQLRGRLELATAERLSGWVMDPAAPGQEVRLALLVDGAECGRFVARTWRGDLEQAGIGDGRHGFAITIPGGLPAERGHEVRLLHADDGREIPGSPATIPRGAEAAAGEGSSLADAVMLAAKATDPAAAEALIATLAAEAAALIIASGGHHDPVLAARLARSGTALPAASRKPRALFIDEGVPAVGRDAGSNAALSHMRALMRLGYDVHFVAGASVERAGARSAGLEALGVTCWHAPWIGSVEEVLRRLGDGLALVYVHRFGVIQRYGALARRWAPRARLIYCVADLHFLRAARRLAVEAGLPPDDAATAATMGGLRMAELAAAVAADAVITHSSHEAALLRRDIPEANTHLVPWDVPLRPGQTAGGRGVAFVGSYGHAPNLDAAHELLEQVMPLVWAEDATIPLLLAGSDLPSGLRAAGTRPAAGPVEVLGWVDDLDALFARVRLTASPLRYGAGLKGKVLDSLAAGLPCLCSPMAAEGMDLPEPLTPLIATTAADMAASILRLHRDEAEYIEMRDAGLAWIGEHFSPARIDAALGAALGPTP